MDKDLYFGAADQMKKNIQLDRRNTDKLNGFVFGQSGEGCGFHADAQPSGMALAARQEMSNEGDIILDPVNIFLKIIEGRAAP
ncbi:MAG: hypothetical protein IKQ91_01755 [Oscillospiraceae bacterium]|nr:hypothetical protein [Oscillospiraceae bacterium]MBR3448400.1 hypothetical protein [Oscillospiraceae bacterium]MBR4199987.1 hypothetical protein [Oscillospiraceae bacterium]